MLLVLLGGNATAQDNVLPGFKIVKPPTIDGVIDPTEWEGAPTSQGMFDDENGDVAKDNLQFWIAYDKTCIYFAAKVYDSDPSSIRATEYRTNVSLSGDDHIKLVLDLSGSLSDFNEFGMNPKGATSIELAGGRAAKREWSGEFVSKGRITPEGWEVEARIPWQIMRLPSAGIRTIRFNVERALMRTQRDYIWKYTGSGQREQIGKLTDVEIPATQNERIIKLLPYAFGGIEESEGTQSDAGLDFKTNLADQVSLIGSINPDFRNIENAILSLDFSRFERLAGETRPFFQEGSQYLNSALFASQRIRDFDAGINVHGKLSDKISFGILNAIEFGDRNSFVANFTYAPTPNDNLRITTTNFSRDGLSNEGYLIRFFKAFGPLNVTVRNMTTLDSDEGKGDHNSIYFEYFKDGLFGFLGYEAVSPEFLPRLGFVPETDYKGPTIGFEWNKPINSNGISELNFQTYYANLKHFDGSQYREFLESSGQVALINGLSIGASIELDNFEGVKDSLYGLSARFPRGNPYKNIAVGVNWGQLEMTNYHSVSFSSAYRITERLQLTASYQHVDHFERSDLGILGMNYDFGHDMYLSGRVVKREDDWNAYLSFRRSGNRGTEYFLIIGDPNAQTFQSSLIIKVVTPFEIK